MQMVKYGLELVQLVVLQFLCVFFHFVVCSSIFAKCIRSRSDIGKITECF